MTYITAMKRKSSGNKPETVNIVVSGIGRARPQRQKNPTRRGKSPGSAAHHFTTANASKYGVKGGSAPRIPKFADAYEAKLLDPVPAKLRRQLGLPAGATLMDVVIQSVVQNAMTGSIPHVQEVREVTQGKVANKNINVSAELELYATNPAFRQFIVEKLEEFKAKQLPSGE